MKPALIIAFVVSLSMAAAASYTEYCQYSSSRTEGQNKICYYRCPSGPYATTIRSVELCPINLAVERK